MKSGSNEMLKAISNITKRPYYSPASLEKLLAKLGINERSLAWILNVSPRTVRLWRRGKASPSNPSSRLLQLLELDTAIVKILAACELSFGRSVCNDENHHYDHD